MPHKGANSPAVPEPSASGASVSPRVMLLSVWAPGGAAWHASLIGADACVHEFDSPFELARFLAQPGRRAGPPRGGLR